MRTAFLILCSLVLASCSTTRPPITAHRPGEMFRDCTDCPQMVVVPGGSFTMGSPVTEPGRFDDDGLGAQPVFSRMNLYPDDVARLLGKRAEVAAVVESMTV